MSLSKICIIKTEIENYRAKFLQANNGKNFIVFNKGPWFDRPKQYVTEYEVKNEGLDELHASGNFLHLGEIDEKGVLKVSYLNEAPPEGFDEVLLFKIGDGALSNDNIAEFGKYWEIKGFCRYK